MKAKRIRRIRQKTAWYLVQKTRRLFGNFDIDNTSGERVLARNPEEAVRRYCKRNHIFITWVKQCSETYGRYKIVPEAKPYNRFITYWK